MSILVLGLGNLLMQDDAVGVHAVQRLQREFHWSSQVRILDGGTLGLDLLPYLEEAQRVLIIDALEMRSTPGSVHRLVGEEVPRAFAGKLSVHQMGLQDLLAVAELQGTLPAEVVVLGVQAVSVDMGLELTPTVAAALDGLIVAVLEQLQQWGAVPLAA
jgi:hydrogenase maturation protease